MKEIIEYYDDGKTKKRHYRENLFGKETHLYEVWYDNGNLKEHSDVKDGIYICEEWYKNGNIKSRETYYNSKNTLCEHWLENGQMYSRETTKNNESSGEIWDTNGVLRCRINAKNGKYFGKQECWMPNEKGEMVCYSAMFDGDFTKEQTDEQRLFVEAWKEYADSMFVAHEVMPCYSVDNYTLMWLGSVPREDYLVMKITAGCIQEGILLNYRLDFCELDGAWDDVTADFPDPEFDYMKKFFKKISLEDCKNLFGALPDAIREDKLLYLGLLRVPFFYDCHGHIENVLYMKYENNGRSTIEASRPELLLPFMHTHQQRIVSIGSIAPSIHELENAELEDVEYLK